MERARRGRQRRDPGPPGRRLTRGRKPRDRTRRDGRLPGARSDDDLQDMGGRPRGDARVVGRGAADGAAAAAVLGPRAAMAARRRARGRAADAPRRETRRRDVPWHAAPPGLAAMGRGRLARRRARLAVARARGHGPARGLRRAGRALRRERARRGRAARRSAAGRLLPRDLRLRPRAGAACRLRDEGGGRLVGAVAGAARRARSMRAARRFA
jgi:hypothetical protein